MLTGPFFLFFTVFKYTLKGILFTYLWRRNKAKKLLEEQEKAAKAAKEATLIPI